MKTRDDYSGDGQGPFVARLPFRRLGRNELMERVREAQRLAKEAPDPITKGLLLKIAALWLAVARASKAA